MLLSLDGFKHKLRIVPYAIGCGPLQEPGDLRIVAAVVEVLRVESVFHDTTFQVEHFDVPVLATVLLVDLFAHDAGIVLARIAITQHQFGVGHRADAVSERNVEARCFSQLNLELCRLVAFGFGLGQQHQVAVRYGSSHFGAVGGNKEHELAVRFGFPQLCFVRTVVFTGFQSITLGADGTVVERIDKAPRAGKFTHVEVLSGVGSITFLEC